MSFIPAITITRASELQWTAIRPIKTQPVFMAHQLCIARRWHGNSVRQSVRSSRAGTVLQRLSRLLNYQHYTVPYRDLMKFQWAHQKWVGLGLISDLRHVRWLFWMTVEGRSHFLLALSLLPPFSLPFSAPYTLSPSAFFVIYSHQEAQLSHRNVLLALSVEILHKLLHNYAKYHILKATNRRTILKLTRDHRKSDRS